MSATTQFDLDLTQFRISLSLFYCRKCFEVVWKLKAAPAFRVFAIETGQFDELVLTFLFTHFCTYFKTYTNKNLSGDKKIIKKICKCIVYIYVYIIMYLYV